MRFISIITGNYPSLAQPMCGTFVQEFARALVRQGVGVTVIQPVAAHRVLFRSAYRYHEAEHIDDRASLNIYRPRFLSHSARDAFKKLGPFNPSRFTFRAFTAAAQRVMRNERINAEAIYGHFLYMAGAAAVHLGCELGIPSFPCVGEGELWTVRWFGEKQARKDLAAASGFIANSCDLKQTLIHDLGIPEQRIGVFPNGADLSVFNPKDKSECRKRFGLPQDSFLVCSAGNFLYKKGVVRVGEAIHGLEGVAGVFAGSGPMPPQASNTAFCDRVSHDEMPYLISACDVFVLPTLIEGSCNAIVEAMACGLPIISSNGTFNDDLLTEDMSIRINPLDVAAIRQCITALQSDKDTLDRMSAAAVIRSKHFDINRRASRIVEFVREQKKIN
jgi:teichuronic acid biosynthesis glycosyltransferase TuaC